MKRIEMEIQNGNGPSHAKAGSTDPHPKNKEKKRKKILTPEEKRRKKKRTLIMISIILILILGTCGVLIYKTNQTFEILGINTSPTATIGNLITQKEPELEKDDENRTNALIVGVDTRPENPGLQNTDTIIVASYDHDTNEATMISIPRDTWAAYPDNPSYFTKINGIYNYCENQEEGSGMECLVDVAQTITNLDIHYYGLVDITGLVNVIDILGGVEVDVERSFTDYMFPNEYNDWEVVSFEEGPQHMDGETAMQYARSRHAQGPEGSDFSRARRQQKLIMAVKEKILSSETFQNPLKIIEIIEELGDSITLSDISTEDIRAGLALKDKAAETETYTFVLDPSAGNWTLITEDPSAAYILLPKAGPGEWEDIQTYLTEILDNPALYSEKSTIYIYNGGLGYNEAYQKYSEFVETYPYLATTFGGNASLQTYTGTSIYNFKDTPHLAALEELGTYFDTEWTSEIPENLINIYGEDIVIILGAPVGPELTELEETGSLSQ